MKRSAIPGLLLALIGIVLFARQDIARVMQKRTAPHSASVRKSQATLKAEAFPLASVLAGFFFMSGVGLVAVSAHPIALFADGKSRRPRGVIRSALNPDCGILPVHHLQALHASSLPIHPGPARSRFHLQSRLKVLALFSKLSHAFRIDVLSTREALSVA